MAELRQGTAGEVNNSQDNELSVSKGSSYQQEASNFSKAYILRNIKNTVQICIFNFELCYTFLFQKSPLQSLVFTASVPIDDKRAVISPEIALSHSLAEAFA